jgi:hypothetical protein
MKSHGVPAHDQALHMTVTRFRLFCAYRARPRGKGNVDHRRPAFRAGTRGQTTIMYNNQYSNSGGFGYGATCKAPTHRVVWKRAKTVTETFALEFTLLTN